jgi:hypothetical protein
MITSKLEEEMASLELTAVASGGGFIANDDLSLTAPAKNGGGNGILSSAQQEPSAANGLNGNGVGGRGNGVLDLEGLPRDVIHV